jgi:acetolactate synthase-1/2/3 large subunit
MNGAESILKTLLDAGVDTCFTNPGTSEMHFVHAIGSQPRMRSILGLFEGVCTGAADGYARMTGKPACTLLHLGPGLANATANIHNARRGHSPMVNIIGDHATYHLQYDAPLASNIHGLASAFGDWVKSAKTADGLSQDGAEAVKAALENGGQIANLIVPADCAWNNTEITASALTPNAAPKVPSERIDKIAKVLKEKKDGVIIVIGGKANDTKALEALDKIAQASGATVLFETFNSRIPRGAGRVKFDKVAYFVEMAQDQFKHCQQVITVGAKSPVAFFAYPNRPSTPLPEGCESETLAAQHEDVMAAIDDLVEALNANHFAPRLQEAVRPQLLTGPLLPKSIGFAMGVLLPENVIIVDEAATSGGPPYGLTEGIPEHDWLQLTGGSIGYGLPVATGAAVACPDRKVICVHGDGGAMYTIQSLWTQARENLDVINIICANRKYQILQVELMRVGATAPNQKTLDMLDIGNPDLNFQQIGEGMGVRSSQATTAEEFNKQLENAVKEKGPSLIEAIF